MPNYSIMPKGMAFGGIIKRKSGKNILISSSIRIACAISMVQSEEEH
jgi:hypothetical protein